MLDVRRLRALRELSDRGTIAAAADALHLTASAVSQQLSALEAELGEPLLERTGRAVRLTPAARVVLRHADAMLAETERLEAELHELREGRGGRVRIGSFATGIVALVAPMTSDPEIRAAGLELEVIDVESPEAFDRLARRELDVVVSMESDGVPTLQDGRMGRVPLMADVLDAALPAGHPLARAATVELRDLAGEEWIVPPRGWSCEHVVTAGCAAAGFRPDVRHRSSDWNAVMALVAAGLGVSIVPRLAQAGRPDGVVIRPLDGEPPARHLFAASRRGSETHPANVLVLRALQRAAEAELSARSAPSRRRAARAA